LKCPGSGQGRVLKKNNTKWWSYTYVLGVIRGGGKVKISYGWVLGFFVILWNKVGATKYGSHAK
jgi:hypothetical protein